MMCSILNSIIMDHISFYFTNTKFYKDLEDIYCKEGFLFLLYVFCFLISYRFTEFLYDKRNVSNLLAIYIFCVYGMFYIDATIFTYLFLIMTALLSFLSLITVFHNKAFKNKHFMLYHFILFMLLVIFLLSVIPLVCLCTGTFDCDTFLTYIKYYIMGENKPNVNPDNSGGNSQGGGSGGGGLLKARKP